MNSCAATIKLLKNTILPQLWGTRRQQESLTSSPVPSSFYIGLLSRRDAGQWLNHGRRPLRVCASPMTGEASLPFLHLLLCLCKTCWFNRARVPSNVQTPPKPNRKWGCRLTTHKEGQRSVCGGPFWCSHRSNQIPFCKVGPGWLLLRLPGDSLPPRALPPLAPSLLAPPPIMSGPARVRR